MAIYFEVIRFHFLRFLVYPTEMLAVVLRKIIFIGSLILFWGIIAQSSQGNIDTRSMTSYLLIAGAISEMLSAESLRFAKYIGDSIKFGRLNIFLIRPLNLIPYMYASSLGEQSFSIIIALISLGLGIYLQPPASFFSILCFIIFFAIAALISIAINILTGLLAFYTPQAVAFRFTASHIIKVASGLIVPLSLFPDGIKNIFLLSPFPAMIFSPVNSLQYTEPNNQVFQSMGVSAIWAITLFFLALTSWNKAIRNYDAIGI